MEKEIVFVTGGTGLIGTHLLLKLLQQGKSVRALKREDSDIETVKRVFSFYNAADLMRQISWVDGDITDILSLETAMDGVSQVYHTAALVSFNPKDKIKLYKINIEGTANVVNACLEKGVKKLCYVSSTAAIGKTSNGAACTEETTWNEEEVTSNYAISKHYAENEVWRGIAEGLPSVMVNPCVVIGPGDWNRSSGTLFGTVRKGLPFYTAGANAFVDVRDVVDAMYLLMESDIVAERFLTIGENLSYQDIFTKIATSLKVKPPSYLISGWLVDLGWRLEKMRSLITGNAPVVTSESAQSAVNTTKFSANKLKEATGFEFRTIDEATANAGTYYLGK